MQREIRFTVRYAETDQMGVVHHANYPIWFEMGRTDFLQKLGMSYTKIETMGIMLPLYELKCQYKSPARYEDEILVITQLNSLTRTRGSFSYQVLNATNQKLLALGESSHAWTDKQLRPLNAQRTVPDIYELLSKNVFSEKQ